MFVTGDGAKCHQVGCGCQFTNQSGTYEISMEALKEPGTYYVVSGTYWTYYINPCYAFTMPKSDCKDVTMCQKGGNVFFAVANDEIEAFSPFINENSPVTVTYRAIQQGGIGRQMIINLKCGKSDIPPTKVIVGGGSDPLTYTLEIVSPLLCPHQRQKSGGSSSGLSTRKKHNNQRNL
ncbi:Hypothetical predicted protein [Paramuricea clavata]|nr:Hypothetical predicted protein [Paramuricea clavata]